MVRAAPGLAAKRGRVPYATPGRSHHQAAGGIGMSAKHATWDANRIELMMRCFHAGLSCSQIAGEIGVTRNAVIGKLHRLGLSRPRDIAAAQVEERRAARLARAKPQRNWRLSIAARREMLKAALPEAQASVEDIPILNGRGASMDCR
jgi:GcrA cell cycle regulator